MPSKWERIMVNKIVQGIRMGRIKIGEKKKDPEEYRKIVNISKFFNIKYNCNYSIFGTNQRIKINLNQNFHLLLLRPNYSYLIIQKATTRQKNTFLRRKKRKHGKCSIQKIGKKILYPKNTTI